MIVVLQADGSVTLEQATDFRRFHCEIAPGIKSWEQARDLFTLGEIESADTAWIDEAGLYLLGESVAGAGWREQAAAMVAFAARSGWLRERAPRIRSHVVWRR